MGNVFDNRSSLLAKHWTQVAPNTYRNTITDQLIDSHQLALHSEEELSFNNSLLLKRAALSHPNVPKLIYFSPSSTPLCGSASHGVTLYLEHTQPLPSKIPEQSTNLLCACCAIVNGLLYLSDRYGWFKVEEGLIRGGQESGLQGKQTIVPKIWIHHDLKVNYPAATATEFQMSRQTANLLMSLGGCLCRSGSPLPPSILKCSGLEQLAQAVYHLHNQTPELTPRKRTVSQLKNQSFQATLGDQHPPRQQNQHFFNFIMKPPPQANEPFQPVSTIREKEDYLDESIRVKKIVSRRTQEEFPAVQMNPSKRTVKFNFLDVMSTPKSNKIPPLQNHLSQSSSVLEPQSKSILQTGQLDSNKTKHLQSIQPEAINNFNPALRVQENDFLIQEEQSDSRLKELLRATDCDPSYSTLGTQQLQPSPIASLQSKSEPPRKQNLNQSCSEFIHQKNIREDSLVKGNFEGQLDQREDNKEKGVEMEKEAQKKYERESEIQICSIGSGNNEKSGGFEIVSEYHISVDQQAGLGSLQIQHSLEYNGSEPDRIPQPSVFSIKAQTFNYSHRDPTPPCAQGRIPALKSGDKIQSQVQGAQEVKHAEKGYKKYINNFQEVTLSQSNLQASQTPRSERNYFFKETYNESVDGKEHLTSSNNPKKLKKEPCRSRQVDIPDSSCTMEAGGSSWREVNANGKESQFCQEEQKRATIMAKISNTEEVLRQNRKKLELLQLEKDLQKEKNIIKKEMQSLLVNNMMADESHRIKEKVRHKKATFAQLKAEASKILEDLNF